MKIVNYIYILIIFLVYFFNLKENAIIEDEAF